MSEVDPVAERAHQIDYIRHRVASGDLLYSAYTVQVLLDEIAELSERCLPPSPAKGREGGPPVQRCQARATKGTGEGTCDAVLVDGYCPRWTNHIEEE